MACASDDAMDTADVTAPRALRDYLQRYEELQQERAHEGQRRASHSFDWASAASESPAKERPNQDGGAGGEGNAATNENGMATHMTMSELNHEENDEDLFRLPGSDGAASGSHDNVSNGRQIVSAVEIDSSDDEFVDAETFFEHHSMHLDDSFSVMVANSSTGWQQDIAQQTTDQIEGQRSAFFEQRSRDLDHVDFTSSTSNEASETQGSQTDPDEQHKLINEMSPSAPVVLASGNKTVLDQAENLEQSLHMDKKMTLTPTSIKHLQKKLKDLNNQIEDNAEDDTASGTSTFLSSARDFARQTRPQRFQSKECLEDDEQSEDPVLYEENQRSVRKALDYLSSLCSERVVSSGSNSASSTPPRSPHHSTANATVMSINEDQLDPVSASPQTSPQVTSKHTSQTFTTQDKEASRNGERTSVNGKMTAPAATADPQVSLTPVPPTTAPPSSSYYSAKHADSSIAVGNFHSTHTTSPRKLSATLNDTRQLSTTQHDEPVKTHLHSSPATTPPRRGQVWANGSMPSREPTPQSAEPAAISTQSFTASTPPRSPYDSTIHVKSTVIAGHLHPANTMPPRRPRTSTKPTSQTFVAQHSELLDTSSQPSSAIITPKRTQASLNGSVSVSKETPTEPAINSAPTSATSASEVSARRPRLSAKYTNIDAVITAETSRAVTGSRQSGPRTKADVGVQYEPAFTTQSQALVTAESSISARDGQSARPPAYSKYVDTEMMNLPDGMRERSRSVDNMSTCTDELLRLADEANDEQVHQTDEDYAADREHAIPAHEHPSMVTLTQATTTEKKNAASSPVPEDRSHQKLSTTGPMPAVPTTSSVNATTSTPNSSNTLESRNKVQSSAIITDPVKRSRRCRRMLCALGESTIDYVAFTNGSDSVARICFALVPLSVGCHQFTVAPAVLELPPHSSASFTIIFKASEVGAAAGILQFRGVGVNELFSPYEMLLEAIVRPSRSTPYSAPSPRKAAPIKLPATQAQINEVVPETEEIDIRPTFLQFSTIAPEGNRGESRKIRLHNGTHETKYFKVRCTHENIRVAPIEGKVEAYSEASVVVTPIARPFTRMKNKKKHSPPTTPGEKWCGSFKIELGEALKREISLVVSAKVMQALPNFQDIARQRHGISSQSDAFYYTKKMNRRGLYFHARAVECGSCIVGESHQVPVYVCNGSDSPMTVFLQELMEPFSFSYTTTTIQPRKFIEVPVTFTPKVRGKVSTSLYAFTVEQKAGVTLIARGI